MNAPDALFPYNSRVLTVEEAVGFCGIAPEVLALWDNFVWRVGMYDGKPVTIHGSDFVKVGEAYCHACKLGDIHLVIPASEVGRFLDLRDAKVAREAEQARRKLEILRAARQRTGDEPDGANPLLLGCAEDAGSVEQVGCPLEVDDDDELSHGQEPSTEAC